MDKLSFNSLTDSHIGGAMGYIAGGIIPFQFLNGFSQDVATHAYICDEYSNFQFLNGFSQ